MATINEVPVQSHSYVPIEDTERKKGIVSDWYPCHVTKVEVDRRKVKSYEATIYNLTCTVAPECATKQFETVNIQGEKVSFTGDSYVGRKFRSIGVFNFMSPEESDTFEANPSGNVGYMKLCKAFNVEMPSTVVHIDGKPTEVLTLPELTKSDLLGKPVMAFLAKSKPWIGRDGKERRSFEVKAFKTWETGQPTQVAVEDEIPF